MIIINDSEKVDNDDNAVYADKNGNAFIVENNFVVLMLKVNGSSLATKSLTRSSESSAHFYEKLRTHENNGGSICLMRKNTKLIRDYRSKSNMFIGSKKHPMASFRIKTLPKPTMRRVQTFEPLPNCSAYNEDTLVYETIEDHAECTIYENFREPHQSVTIGATPNNKKKLKSNVTSAKPDIAKKPNLYFKV